MILGRFTIGAIALAFGLFSCASPAKVEPEKQPAGTVVKAPQAPVRLNGRGKITSISMEELFALQQSNQALVYDARPAFFYNLGHLPGAISMPKANCDELIIEQEAEIKAALAAKKTIVIYCTNFACPDARTVAMHFSSFAYPSSTLSGGWDAWKEAGLPTE
jgi:rhodanese-related sulfurtransferase